MLLVRPGRRTTAAAAGAAGDPQATTPSTGCAPSSARHGLRRDGGAGACTAITGDVGTDGLGLDDADRATLAALRHRHPLGGRPSPSTRPSTRAVEINLLGPTRIATLLQRARRHAPPRRRVDLLRRRQPPGHRARGARRRRARSTIGLDWRKRGGRRPGGCAPTPRPRAGTPEHAGPLPHGGPQRARRRGRARPGRQDRAAARALGDRPPGRGRPGPGRQRRLARRLRVHEGARRAGADRVEGRRCRSRSCGRRSSSRPSPSPARAGSAASAWPSRSSSPTPAAC